MKRAPSAAPCSVSKRSVRSRDLDHVARLGRQSQPPDTSRPKLAGLGQKDLHLVGQGLHAVDRQEFLIVERVDGEAVQVFLASELTGILVQPMMPRVVASSGDGEGQPSEGKQFEVGFGTCLRHVADGCEGQFDRRADHACPAIDQELRGGFIVDIQERPRDEWPSGTRLAAR